VNVLRVKIGDNEYSTEYSRELASRYGLLKIEQEEDGEVLSIDANFVDAWNIEIQKVKEHDKDTMLTTLLDVLVKYLPSDIDKDEIALMAGALFATGLLMGRDEFQEENR
jgi:hypothetical protein